MCCDRMPAKGWGERALRCMGFLGILLLMAPSVTADSGEAISIDVQQADILTILRTISDLSGENIVPGPEVKGEVTVRVMDVSWQDALDVVLRAHGYGWKYDEANIIRVTTIKNLQNEDLEKEASARKREDLLPLITQIIPVNFAKAGEIEQSLEAVLTKRGDVQTDERTNSLIVKDIDQNVQRAVQLVKKLDQITKQVEIVIKLVDVDARVSQELGIEWLASGLNNDNVDATGNASVSAVIGQPIGTFSVGTAGPGGDLEATLQALASENKAEIISNPRITTLDNQEANILVGKKIPLIVSDPSGNPITELTTIGIQMTVTPHVHSNGNVTMELDTEVSDLSSQATVQGGIIIVTSEANTRVMVQSGQTAVIGGLIRKNTAETELGIPLLRDIPLFGHLFKSSSNVEEQRELLIFVTPTIIEVGDLTDASEIPEAVQ